MDYSNYWVVMGAERLGVQLGLTAIQSQCCVCFRIESSIITGHDLGQGVRTRVFVIS